MVAWAKVAIEILRTGQILVYISSRIHRMYWEIECKLEKMNERWHLDSTCATKIIELTGFKGMSRTQCCTC